MRRLRNIGRLVTGTSAGVISNAAVICDDELIAWAGRSGDEPHQLLGSVDDEHDCGGGLVTAGLIDAHTHPVYAGDRMPEVAMRTAGACGSGMMPRTASAATPASAIQPRRRSHNPAPAERMHRTAAIASRITPALSHR